MIEKLRRFGIALLIAVIFYSLGFINLFSDSECFSPWLILNIPLQIIVGIGNAIIIGFIGLLGYSCVWPFIQLSKWIINGTK